MCNTQEIAFLNTFLSIMEKRKNTNGDVCISDLEQLEYDIRGFLYDAIEITSISKQSDIVIMALRKVIK